MGFFTLFFFFFFFVLFYFYNSSTVAKFQVLRENTHIRLCLRVYLYTYTHIFLYVYTQTYISCRSVNQNFLEQYILVDIEYEQFWYIQVTQPSGEVGAEPSPRTPGTPHWSPRPWGRRDPQVWGEQQRPCRRARVSPGLARSSGRAAVSPG